MQTQQVNPNVWIDENGFPHYLHGDYWYGPNSVQSAVNDVNGYPVYFEKTNGEIIDTENGQYLYCPYVYVDNIWYGQDKIFQLNDDGSEWEQKQRGENFFTVSHEDESTISKLTDIQIVSILSNYFDAIEELSKYYNDFIKFIQFTQKVYGNVTLSELKARSRIQYNFIFKTYLKFLGKVPNIWLTKKYSQIKLTQIRGIVSKKLREDEDIAYLKSHYRQGFEEILQNMLYHRIIFFYLRYHTQNQIDEEVKQYIESFEKSKYREVIIEEYEKIEQYLKNALEVSNSTPLNVLEIDESELLGTETEMRRGSDNFSVFEDDFVVSCLTNSKCYIFMSSNHNFSVKLTNENSKAMLYTGDILIKAMLSFRTWLFKCTGEPGRDPDGNTSTDGVLHDLILEDSNGNKLIGPITYAPLPIMGDSTCLVSLSNIFSILHGKNRVVYVVMKEPLLRSVSWNLLYNYNPAARVSGKHCQEGSNQQVCELHLSNGQVSEQARSIRKHYDDAAEQVKNRILASRDVYLNRHRQFDIANRAYYELEERTRIEEESGNDQFLIELLKQKERERLKRLDVRKRRDQRIMREIRKGYREKQSIPDPNLISIQPNGIELISYTSPIPSGSPIRRGSRTISIRT